MLRSPRGSDHPNAVLKWAVSTLSILPSLTLWAVYSYPGGGRAELKLIADRIVSSESDFFIGSTLTHTFMIFYSTLYDAEGDGDTLWEMYNSGMICYLVMLEPTPLPNTSPTYAEIATTEMK